MYKGKGIIQLIHSSVGANTEGDGGRIVHFLASVYTFSGKIGLVYVHRQKILSSIITFGNMVYTLMNQDLGKV